MDWNSAMRWANFWARSGRRYRVEGYRVHYGATAWRWAYRVDSTMAAAPGVGRAR